MVFDCSAESHGTSLNKELIPGLELTSQLVGVLQDWRSDILGWYISHDS